MLVAYLHNKNIIYIFKILITCGSPPRWVYESRGATTTEVKRLVADGPVVTSTSTAAIIVIAAAAAAVSIVRLARRNDDGGGVVLVRPQQSRIGGAVGGGPFDAGDGSAEVKGVPLLIPEEQAAFVRQRARATDGLRLQREPGGGAVGRDDLRRALQYHAAKGGDGSAVRDLRASDEVLPHLKQAERQKQTKRNMCQSKST
jgi:hypothetical protein